MVFTSRAGNIYQHYKRPLPQLGRGYDLVPSHQRGSGYEQVGSGNTIVNGAAKARLVDFFRSRGYTQSFIEAAGEMARDEMISDQGRKDPKGTIMSELTNLGVPSDLAMQLTKFRALADSDTTGPAFNDLGRYLEDGDRRSWEATDTGLVQSASAPSAAAVAQASQPSAQDQPSLLQRVRDSFVAKAEPGRGGTKTDDPKEDEVRPAQTPNPAQSDPAYEADDSEDDSAEYEDAPDRPFTPPRTTRKFQGAPTSTIAAAAATLAPVSDGISELSPLQRARLLVSVQESPAIMEMIRLELLDWTDLIEMKDGVPTLKLDYIATLHRELAQLTTQRQTQDVRAMQFRRQQRAAGGFQTSTLGGPFGRNVKVWEGPKYAPGRLPYPQNSITY
jgi:hypothetical protein